MNENMSVYKPDWLEAKQRMESWWAGKKVDRVVASITAPIRLDSIPPYIKQAPDMYTDPDTVFHNLDRQLKHTFWGGEAFPHHFVYCGPIYTSTVYFGANPHFTENTTWYNPCYNNLDEVIAYEPDAANNKWYQIITGMQKKSVERSTGSYLVTLIGVKGIIDTLAALIGNEELLLAMIDEPGKVIEARDKLLQYFVPTFDESYTLSYDCNGGGSMDSLGIWAPGRATTTQCDLCGMISTDMFDKFVFDDLKFVYDRVDHGLYHLDGEGEIKHLDSILSIDKIHMVQWVPTSMANGPSYSDPLNWIGLFKRIQNAGRSVMIYAAPGQVKELLNKIDRDLVFLNVSCPDGQTAYQVLRDLEMK